jgi:hypothetical protein
LSRRRDNGQIGPSTSGDQRFPLVELQVGDSDLTPDRQEIRIEPVAARPTPADGEAHKFAAESQGDGKT